jgi:hypothetical protein
MCACRQPAHAAAQALSAPGHDTVISHCAAALRTQHITLVVAHAEVFIGVNDVRPLSLSMLLCNYRS